MTKKLPSILSQPIDLTTDLDWQFRARYSAACDYFNVAGDGPEQSFGLIAALMLERFPKAFRLAQPKPRDPRCKVAEPEKLLRVVTALRDGKIEDLSSDQRLHKTAQAAQRYLLEQGGKPNITRACNALSKVAGSWKGEKPTTLRDNIARPPGEERTRKERNNRALKKALEATIKAAAERYKGYSEEQLNEVQEPR